MQRGWKERRAKADRTDYDADARAEARAVRTAYYAELAAADRAAIAAQEAAMATAQCHCPACGGDGLVSPEFGARIVTALEKLSASAVIDPSVLRTLQAAIVTHVAQAVDPVADARAVITRKDVPLIPTKPRRKPTAAEIYAAGDDGVAELDD
jgi:hypothetical protein